MSRLPRGANRPVAHGLKAFLDASENFIGVRIFHAKERSHVLAWDDARQVVAVITCCENEADEQGSRADAVSLARFKHIHSWIATPKGWVCDLQDTVMFGFSVPENPRVQPRIDPSVCYPSLTTRNILQWVGHEVEYIQVLPDKPFAHIPKLLRLARKAQGRKQYLVARKVDMAQSSLRQAESGMYMPDHKVLARLAKLYGYEIKVTLVRRKEAVK